MEYFVTLYFLPYYLYSVTKEHMETLLWEEKDLTVPLKRLESNGETEGNDTIESIQKQLENKSLIDTTERRRLKGKLKYHKRKKKDPLFMVKTRVRRKHWRSSRYFVRQSGVLKEKLKDCYYPSAWELWKLAKKQKLICSLTGRKLTIKNISVDHILPLSKGGTNALNNLRFVDRHANLARLTFSDNELFELAKDIVNTFTKK